MRKLLAFLSSALLFPLLAQQLLPLPPAPASGTILPMDTLTGVVTGNGSKNSQTKIEIVDEAGVKSTRIFAKTASDIEWSQYYSFRVTFPEPLNLTETAVECDVKSAAPHNTRALYVRFYNKGEAKPAMSFASWDGLMEDDWQTFSFQEKLCPQGLSWEGPVVADRRPTHVNRVEFIIGSREQDVDVDARFRKLRLAKLKRGLNNLKTYPPRIQETILVSKKNAASIILHPNTPKGLEAAQKIAAEINNKTGCHIPCKPGTLEDSVQNTSAIMIGDLNSNNAIRLLYARGLTLVDALCPGPGGFMNHTIHNPFGKGVNVIIVGASDDEGISKATDNLINQIKALPQGSTLALPKISSRSFKGEFEKRFSYLWSKPNANYIKNGLETAQNRLDKGMHTSIAGQLAGLGNRYLLGNNPEDAKLFVELWKVYLKDATDKPNKFGGPWGFDSDFPSLAVVNSWDILEEEPSLTDEERISVIQAMTKWVKDTVLPSCSGGAPGKVTHNHGTFAAQGTSRFAIYLENTFPDFIEAKICKKRSDIVFREQAKYSKPHEDCNGYQWLTIGHTLQYAMMRPDYAIFKSGVADKIVDFCINNMDNFGIQVPYGDTGSWTCWSSEEICLDIIALATGNKDALWATNYKHTMLKTKSGVGAYNQPKPKDKTLPTRFNGVTAWPLIPEFFTTNKANIWIKDPKYCVDKITFREKMDPDALFLLLDGVSTGGHKHDDGNSIPRLSQFNRIWLADNDYFKAPLKYHNSIAIMADGESAKIPAYCELLTAKDRKDTAVSVTRMRDYAKTDWRRAIVWLKKSNAVLVLDRLTALADASYQFRMFWHGIGDPQMDEDGMLLRQKGPSMRIQVAKGAKISLFDDYDLGTNWSSYPHAQPVVRSMSAIASVPLQTNQSYVFGTIFHGKADGDEPKWNMAVLEEEDGIVFHDGITPYVVRFNKNQTLSVTSSTGTETYSCISDYGADGVASKPVPAMTSTGKNKPAWTRTAQNTPLPCRVLAQNKETGKKLQQLDILWQQCPKPDKLLLSGNKLMPGKIPDYAKITFTPQNLGKNVLTNGSNEVGNLFDGSLTQAGNSLMCPVDAKLVLTFEFPEESAVSQLAWAQWHATTSSKKTSYLLDNLSVEASNDGFNKDIRKIGEYTETRKLPNWGSPAICNLSLENIRCKYLRISFTPKPGSSIYLAELCVYGNSTREAVVIPYNITSIDTGKIFKDAEGILLGTETGNLIALDKNGKIAWSKEFDFQINSIKTVDTDKDGMDEIAIAMMGGQVKLLNADGSERWEYVLQQYRRPPHANLLFSGDLNGDGFPEIICGAENWRFYAFDRFGKFLWHYEAVHPSRSGAVADIDGDGKDEVVCGTHYYTMSVVNGEGKLLWRNGFGPICWAIDTGSFNKDKTKGIIAGSGNGCVYYFTSKGQRLLDFNTGEEVHAVMAADLDGNGVDEVLAGSYSHFIYCWDAQAKPRWATDVEAPVNVLAKTGNPARVFAGLADGRLIELHKDGTIAKQRSFPKMVKMLKNFNAGLLAVTDDGTVTLIKH